jgi:DNA-binding transcriptional LysR family regulator
MDFKDFAILQVLYEEMNIKKAAERLYISQPAVSYRIQQLERELNSKLLIRGNKGIQFTAQGEYLVNSTKRLLADTERIIEHLHSMHQEIQGTLKLGVANNFALYRLPSILEHFVQAYPKVKIMLRTGVGKEIMKLLHDGEIHIGIESAGHPWLEHKIRISRERICLISREPIQLEDLPNLHQIHITTPSIKNLLAVWWTKKFSTPPNITMETNYVEICKRMVMNGLGVAFVPSFCLDPHDSLHITEITSESGEHFYMDNWLNYREASTGLPIVTEFIKFIGRE